MAAEEELAARIPAAADNRDEAAARNLVDGEEEAAVAAAEVDLPDATATLVVLGRSTPAAAVAAAEAIRQHCYVQHGVVPCTAVADTVVVAGTLPAAAAADLAGRLH